MLGFGKKVRFFVLDFSVHKFYYKQDKESDNFKFLFNFGQLDGVYPFVVNKQDATSKDMPDQEREERELEEIREQKWNYGLELYYKTPKQMAQ